MIILDNSVLSAFRRLKLLSNLNKLISSAIISKEVFNEYSKIADIMIKISWNGLIKITKSFPMNLTGGEKNIKD